MKYILKYKIMILLFIMCMFAAFYQNSRLTIRAKHSYVKHEEVGNHIVLTNDLIVKGKPYKIVKLTINNNLLHSMRRYDIKIIKVTDVPYHYYINNNIQYIRLDHRGMYEFPIRILVEKHDCKNECSVSLNIEYIGGDN